MCLIARKAICSYETGGSLGFAMSAWVLCNYECGSKIGATWFLTVSNISILKEVSGRVRENKQPFDLAGIDREFIQCFSIKVIVQKDLLT